MFTLTLTTTLGDEGLEVSTRCLAAPRAVHIATVLYASRPVQSAARMSKGRARHSNQASILPCGYVKISRTPSEKSDDSNPMVMNTFEGEDAGGYT